MFNIKSFFKNISKYLEIVFIPSLLITMLLIPVLSHTATFILNFSGISFISYNNIKNIIFGHPIAFIGLLILFAIVILLVFFEFTFLLLSVYNLKIGRAHV